MISGLEADAMRSKRGAYITVVVGLIFGTLALLSQQSTGQAQKVLPVVVWEYKTLDVGSGDPTRSLNELGKQGWELVTSRGYGNEPGSQTSYIFKRAKP
jgi:hypothetical protein